MTDVPEKNLGGRPSTFTREIGQKIIDTVRTMLTVNYSSELHRVPRTTVHQWIDKGRKDRDAGIDSEYAWFADGIREARSFFILQSITKLDEGKTNWQASAWLLERCCAEDFGKDAELYKQLLDDYKMLMQSLLDQNKGVSHGSKTNVTKTSQVDSEGQN